MNQLITIIQLKKRKSGICVIHLKVKKGIGAIFI